MPPLPNVPSPKKRERVMHGVSNRHGVSPRAHHHLSPRLCQMPDPRATVDASFMRNFNDQRHIVQEMKASTVVHAPDHHGYRVPPKLPAALDMLGTMRAEPPNARSLAPAKPPKGLAGLLHDGEPTEILRPAPDASPFGGKSRVVEMSPRRRHSAVTTPGRGAASDYAASERSNSLSSSQQAASPSRGHASTAPTTNRLTAAQRFMQGDSYSKPSVLPNVLPAPPPVHKRSGATYVPDTLPLTQAAPGTGSYEAPEKRFDANTRGLNMGRVAQEEKLKSYVAKEVKTTVRREQERAVVESRLADGQRGLRIEEGRIAAKSRQRGEYQERMTKYKFTK
jgi:hypothetical protein